MKVAVVYESKTGNTKKLAEEIFESIENCEKELCNLDEDELPTADFYFIGFGIHNQNCSMRIADEMEKIAGAGYALFMTCGFMPTDKYRKKLYKNIDVWLPDDAEFVDGFLCQGKVDDVDQIKLISKLPDSEKMLQEMFDIGNSHPDAEDLREVRRFTLETLSKWRLV